MVYIGVFRFRWRLIIALVAVCGLFFGAYNLVTSVIENQAIQSMSWVVANKIVVVDPGHGGPDGGGVGPSGVLEKQITLELGKKVAKYLSQAGGAVIMTRETDCDLSSAGKGLRERKVEDLHNRVKLGNNSNAAAFLSIHTNSFGSTWTGAQVFYSPKSQESRALAECIQNEIGRIMKNTDRKAKPLSPYILRNLEMPAVIIEVGFLSNPSEEKMLTESHYQEKMAYAIYAGTVKYFAGDRFESKSWSK